MIEELFSQEELEEILNSRNSGLDEMMEHIDEDGGIVMEYEDGTAVRVSTDSGQEEESHRMRRMIWLREDFAKDLLHLLHTLDNLYVTDLELKDELEELAFRDEYGEQVVTTEDIRNLLESYSWNLGLSNFVRTLEGAIYANEEPQN